MAGNVVCRRSSSILPGITAARFLADQQASDLEGTGDWSSDECFWLPPPSCNERVGSSQQDQALRVDFRCACFKLSDISTASFTAMVKFVVVFEWNDERLIGQHRNNKNKNTSMYMTTNDLPNDLWGPDIILENSQSDCQIIYDSFLLLDAETGRLKRTVTFHGTVYNPMDLKDFPFDIESMELKFISISNWRTLDGLRFGNDPVNRTYTLHPMLNSPGVDFFTLGWNGKVNEFRMMGWSQKTICSADNPGQPMMFRFTLHMARKVTFYYIKILLPLWLLVITSVAAYGLDPENDLGDKYEFLVTLLLSSIAFLYIIQDSLPKVGYFTVIDKIVIVSLISLVCSHLFSYFISVSESPPQMNWWLACINQGGYWLTNVLLIAPPHWRLRCKKIAMLRQIQLPHEQQRQQQQQPKEQNTSFRSLRTESSPQAPRKAGRASRMHRMQSTGNGMWNFSHFARMSTNGPPDLNLRDGAFAENESD